MIVKAIEKAFRVAKERQWEVSYWAFDIHETIIKPNWQAGNIPTEFYPGAVEALRLIGQRTDIKMILYTCSHPHEIEKYLAHFDRHGIQFDYVNENPEVNNSHYGCYDRKPYFNVLFEDKAGFDANEDWQVVINLMIS